MKHFLFKHHKQIKGERFFFKCWEQSKFEKCLKWFLFVAFLLEQTKVIQLCVDPPMLIIVSSAQGALWAGSGQRTALPVLRLNSYGNRSTPQPRPLYRVILSWEIKWK